MIRILIGALVLWIGCHVPARAQTAGFDAFVTSIASQYHVDVAIAPELIPVVDSVLRSGDGIHTIHELVKRLVNEENISYQLIDGNKLMLRRDPMREIRYYAALLEGHVYNDEDNKPLAFAAIQFNGSSIGTTTNENGHFLLHVPDTTGEIIFHYLGFAPMSMSISSFLHGDGRVHMKPVDVPLEEVVIIIPAHYNSSYITPTLDLAGYHIISEDDVLRGELDRMIGALTNYTAFSSHEGIRIRGAEAENSLVLMDGLPVYDPYHFYNIFSPFNSHYFNSIVLYKNNLPVQYGGRIDGMIQLQSDRNAAKSHLVLDTDLLLSSIEGQVVLPGETVLKIGGRISHTGLLNDALSDSTRVEGESRRGRFQSENEYTTTQRPRFNFYDVNAGITKVFGPGIKAHATYYRSRDLLKNETVSEFQTTGGGMQQHSINVDQTYASTDEWMNEGIAAGTEVKTGDKTTLHAEAFSSMYGKRVNYINTTIVERFGLEEERAQFGQQKNKLASFGMRGWLDRRISDKSSYMIGTDLQWHKSEFEADEDREPYVSGSQKENEATLFGEYQVSLVPRLSVHIGARMTNLRSTNTLYALPNVRLEYALGDRTHLRTAYSKNLQTVYEITVENRFGREIETLALSDPEEKYPVLTSDKYMIGAGYRAARIGLDAEVYYKRTDGLTRITAFMPDPGGPHQGPGQEFYRLITGDGWTAGVDLTLAYRHERFGGAIYYTLSRIAERYERLYNGDYYSPEQDRRHQLKLSGKYRLGRFELSSLFTSKSKAPYLSYVRLDDVGGDLDDVDRESVVSYLPPYFSVDFSLDYSVPLLVSHQQLRQRAVHARSSPRLLLGVSLLNATNHENIEDFQHLGRVSRDFGGDFYITQQTELLGRTGNVRIRIVF
jgi:hypothetical protein